MKGLENRQAKVHNTRLGKWLPGHTKASKIDKEDHQI